VPFRFQIGTCGVSPASQKSSRSPTPAQSKRQAHSRGRSQLGGGSAGGQPRNVSAFDSWIACQAGGGHPSNPSGRGRDDGVRGGRARCPRTIEPIKTLVLCCLSSSLSSRGGSGPTRNRRLKSLRTWRGICPKTLGGTINFSTKRRHARLRSGH